VSDRGIYFCAYRYQGGGLCEGVARYECGSNANVGR
jgi:hypothetical protein